MATAVIAPARTRVAMVAPRFLTVARGVADLRAEPRDGSELVDQVQYGEVLTLLRSEGAWHYVQAYDHYFGWIHASGAAAQATSAVVARVVAVLLADVRERADPDAAVVDRLPAGTWLPATRPSKPAGWLALADGRWVSADDTVLYNELPRRAPTPDDLIATAEAFVGVPYLWGGTTALGIDCSGYAQQVYRLNGVRLDRDAHQQAVEGTAVKVASRGDLVFFGQQNVTHVGIAVDERSFLNAPESGKRVQLDDLEASGRNVLAIRRYLR